ncbi:MAG: DUF2225 domain-containing protein [Brevinema sp.]
MAETTSNSVTFFSKKEIVCPLCSCSFQREELQTGRGRINAGDLTPELRRLYIPTQKYGVVNPLLYPLAVCPQCLFAGLPSDFQRLSNIGKQDVEAQNRHTMIKKIFGKTIDFTVNRDIAAGLASYVLAFMSTTHLEKDFSPTLRRGLYALRAAWLAGDLFAKSGVCHLGDLKTELYKQSLLNYESAMEKQLKNQEPFDGLVWMGPDVDTNFGYDGVIYIIGVLLYNQIEFLPDADKIKRIEMVKRNLSRIFGMGKSTRDKPEILISYTRDLYNKMNADLKRLEERGIDVSSAMNIEGMDNVSL